MLCMVPGEANHPLAQMRRGAVEYCVLALLRDGERYGFDIARSLSGEDSLMASEGTLYPLLARLRRSGWVASEWRESSEGPPRRYYSLTDEGRLTLAEFIERWKRFKASIDNLLQGGE